MECDRIIPADVLDDLCSRFIINVPEEERKDLIRICFQIENAHWFYLDFYCKDFPANRKPCGIKEFALQIFNHIPFLQGFSQNIDKIIEDWKDYKFCVPTFGAILLDEDLSHVLLVQSYCSRSSWGFPKGKVNKEEPPHQCAIREVYEETGFDISNLIDPREYIEANVNEQVVRLYIIPGVDKKEKFEPQTRYEIKAVNWFPLSDIPLNKKDSASKLRSGGSSAFFLVFPFLRKLRQWIYARNQRLIPASRRPRHKSCGDIEYLRQRYSSSFDFNESVKILKNLKEQENNDVANKSNSEQNSFNSKSKHLDFKVTMKSETSAKLDEERNETSRVLNHLQTQNSLLHVAKWTYDNQKYLEQTEKLRKLFWLQSKDSDKLEVNIKNADTLKDKDGSEIVEIFHIENMTKNEEKLKTKRSNADSENINEKDIDSSVNNFINSHNADVNTHLNKTSNRSDPSRNIFLEMLQNYSNICEKQETKSVLKKERDRIEMQSNDHMVKDIPSWVNFKFDTQIIIRSMRAALKKRNDI